MRGVHHLDGQFFGLGQRKEAACDRQQPAQQIRFDAMAGEIKKADITCCDAQFVQKCRPGLTPRVEAAQVELWNGGGGRHVSMVAKNTV